MAGWWYTYPSEKYESQWEGLSHILWKNKSHVPNHQPDNDGIIRSFWALTNSEIGTREKTTEDPKMNGFDVP
jgi:hypothetical protein